MELRALTGWLMMVMPWMPGTMAWLSRIGSSVNSIVRYRQWRRQPGASGASGVSSGIFLGHRENADSTAASAAVATTDTAPAALAAAITLLQDCAFPT